MRLLVLSATASAINFQLALADRPDVELFMTDANPYAAGLYTDGIHSQLVPRARDLDEYRVALDRILPLYSIDAMIPTSDHDLEGVMELLHQGWQPDVAMFRPDYSIYRTMTNKASLMAALAEKGVEVPATYRRPEDAEFPCVVKPTREGGTKGVRVVRNERELGGHIDHLRRLFGDDFVIQQFIPGGVGSIHVVLMLYGPDGRLHGEVASHSHLTFMTWGGGGNAGTIVQEPGLLAQARGIITRLGGWVGPINLEFKRHQENGRFYLLEVNCRLNGYSYLFTMNGLNFPASIVKLLRGEEPEFLSFPEGRAVRNFVIGFRERPVEQWLDVRA